MLRSIHWNGFWMTTKRAGLRKRQERPARRQPLPAHTHRRRRALTGLWGDVLVRQRRWSLPSPRFSMIDSAVDAK